MIGDAVDVVSASSPPDGVETTPDAIAATLTPRVAARVS